MTVKHINIFHIDRKSRKIKTFFLFFHCPSSPHWLTPSFPISSPSTDSITLSSPSEMIKKRLSDNHLAVGGTWSGSSASNTFYTPACWMLITSVIQDMKALLLWSSDHVDVGGCVFAHRHSAETSKFHLMSQRMPKKYHITWDMEEDDALEDYRWTREGFFPPVVFYFQLIWFQVFVFCSCFILFLLINGL